MASSRHCNIVISVNMRPVSPKQNVPMFVSEVAARPCRGGRGLTPRCDTREEWWPNQPTNVFHIPNNKGRPQCWALISPYLETHENPTRSHVARERDQIPRWLAFCSLLLHYTAGGCIQADSLFDLRVGYNLVARNPCSLGHHSLRKPSTIDIPHPVGPIKLDRGERSPLHVDPYYLPLIA